MQPIRYPVKVISYPEKRRPIQKLDKTKKQRWTFREIRLSIWNYMKTYFNCSCLHCLSYLADENVSWPLKLIWAVIMLCCYIACILIGKQSIDRFNYKSTVISVERDFHYWNTSLGSVTVCPLTRLDVRRFRNYCNENNLHDKAERDELFNFLESLANSSYYNFDAINATPRIDGILDRLKIIPKNYMELIYNLTTDLTTTNEMNATSGTFRVRTRQILTEYGICYLSNTMLGLEYSTSYALFGRYPQKITGPKILNIAKGTFFDREVTFYMMGAFPGNSTISYVHSPYDVWAIDKTGFFTSEMMKFHVSVLEIMTDDDFETDVYITQRKCRFNHESNLTHFPIYSKYLCLQECRLNLVNEICGCIPHFYPNKVAEPKTVCDYKTLKTCFPPLMSSFLKLYKVEGDKRVYLKCKCFDNCKDAKITIGSKMELTNVAQFTQTIGVQMDVSEWPEIRLKRQVVYTFKDLLVSLGSTAGFFLGFSVLSLVELIYFFTIRLFFHLRGIRI